MPSPQGFLLTGLRAYLSGLGLRVQSLGFGVYGLRAGVKGPSQVFVLVSYRLFVSVLGSMVEASMLSESLSKP